MKSSSDCLTPETVVPVNLSVSAVVQSKSWSGFRTSL